MSNAHPTTAETLAKSAANIASFSTDVVRKAITDGDDPVDELRETIERVLFYGLEYDDVPATELSDAAYAAAAAHVATLRSKRLI